MFKKFFASVLFSFIAVSLLPARQTGAADAEAKDIVETAVAVGKFKTLAKALEAAGLFETLKGKGPFTVFAPTDDAFARLPKGTVEGLLQDKKKLATVLTYHVSPRTVAAKDINLFESAVLKSVEGSPIAISAGAGTVTLNRLSKVIQADIICRNGVIHVIDTVLLPPALSEAYNKEVVVTFCKALPMYAGTVLGDVNFGNWDRAEDRSKEFLGLVAKLKDETPTKGTQASWDSEVSQVAKATNAISQHIANKDTFSMTPAITNLYRACVSCHQSHKNR